MKKYYYIENDIQRGPYTIEELIDKNIHQKTLVWSEDMENWEEANKVIEIKKIIKIIPPPLPNKLEKPIKVEAEIIRKKEKIITPDREIIIAKETKRIFKNLLLSIILCISFFSILFIYNEGLSNFLICQKLQDDLNQGTPSYYEIESRNAERQTLKDESERLGYYYDKESYGGFDTYNAISYHNGRISSAIDKSIKPTLSFSFFLFVLLILGKYIFNGAKWVNEKSNT